METALNASAHAVAFAELGRASLPDPDGAGALGAWLHDAHDEFQRRFGDAFAFATESRAEDAALSRVPGLASGPALAPLDAPAASEAARRSDSTGEAIRVMAGLADAQRALASFSVVSGVAHSFTSSFNAFLKGQ